MKTRKILIIILIIIILIALGSAIYYFFFNSTGPNGQDGGNDGTELFPFGNSNDPELENTGSIDGGDGGGDIGLTENIPGGISYNNLSSVPVAGSTFVYDDKGVEYIRYMERATGHIYDTDIETGEKTRISNTTIPKIYNTYWGNNSGFIVRTLTTNNRENTSYSKISSDSLSSLDLVSFPLDIKLISVSLDKNSVIYGLGNTQDGMRFFVSNLDGSNKINIYNSPIYGWVGEWVNNKIVLLTTKPSGGVDGFAYKLNTSSGSISKVIGPKKGLVAKMSPDEKYIIFSESSSGEFRLGLLDIKTNKILGLGVKTTPDKCVWDTSARVYCAVPSFLENGLYPDNWYKGKVSFDDNIVVIDTRNGVLDNVITPDDFGDGVDVIDMKINKDGSILTFINKKDLSLWGLRLK